MVEWALHLHKYHVATVGFFATCAGVLFTTVIDHPATHWGVLTAFGWPLVGFPWSYAYPDRLSRSHLGLALILIGLVVGAADFTRRTIEHVALTALYRILALGLAFVFPFLCRPVQFRSRMVVVYGLCAVGDLVQEFVHHAILLPVILLVVAVAVLVVLVLDRGQVGLVHEPGYLLVLGYVSMGVPYTLFKIGVGMQRAGMDPSLLLLGWSMGIWVLKELWIVLVDRGVDGAHEMVFLFPLQLTDDVFCSLLFTRIDFPSFQFGLFLAVFMVRDILRDSGVSCDIFEWALRIRRDVDRQAVVLRKQSYISVQNLLSEFTAGFVVIAVLLTEMGLDAGRVGRVVTISPHQTRERALLGGVVYLVGECVVHLVVKWLLELKVKRIRSRMPYLTTKVYPVGVDAPPSPPVGVLDPNWNLAQDMFVYFRHNAAYLDLVVIFVILYLLASVAEHRQ